MFKICMNPCPMLRTGLFFALLGLAVSLSAGEGGFNATLSTGQKNSAGLAVLTAEERALLDQLVAAELALVRRENGSEFEGTFAARRTEEERKQTGLDRLTPEQLTSLNGLIAAALATSPKPKERPRIKETEVFSPKRKPEVHGELSLTFGRGTGGSNFRAASMWVDVFDPNTGLGVGVGISQFSGKGFYRCRPGAGFDPLSDYSPGFGYNGYSASPFRNFTADDLSDGDGRPTRLMNDWSNPALRYR